LRFLLSNATPLAEPFEASSPFGFVHIVERTPVSVPDASPPSVPSLSSAASPSVLPGNDLDPELLALPDPPRGERTLTVLVLAFTALVACAMSFTLRGDVAYAFSDASALDLGELRDVGPISAADGMNNRLVRARGLLGAAGAIRFERPFESDSYRVSPVAGRRDLWVEVHVPAGEESGRYIPPSSFAGRLVPFDDAGPRHRGLVSAIGATTGEPVPAGARVLVDGEVPSRARWAVALALVFLAFAVWNALAIARLLRRAR
jgi:hypothetical protein